MKTPIKMLAAAAALAVCGVAMAAGPTVKSTGKAAQPHKSLAAAIYSQMDNDLGVGIVSQNFEATYDVYDNSGADDFTVPAGQKWIVKSVNVGGAYFNGSGPMASVNVNFYKNKAGKPGAAVASFPALVPSDNGGSLSIALPSAVKLKAGSYWMEVQANMDFAVGGEWAWENRSVVNGAGAVWQNPGNGFGTGCTTWGDEATCIPNGQGDKMFALYGKVK